MNTVSRFFALIAVLAAFMPSPFVDAQSAPFASKDVFKVPFAFDVNGQRFAAGTYAFSKYDSTKMSITSADGSSRAVFCLKDAEGVPAEGSELVFQRFGSYYQLSELRASGLGVHATFFANKKRMKEVMGAGSAPETVKLVLPAAGDHAS
jgi:hypothetical protein